MSDSTSFFPFCLNIGSRNQMMLDIIDFHKKFGLTCNATPGPLGDELQAFRIKFLEEELEEYKKSVADGDLAGTFDALLDLMYVTLGTVYLHNFPLDYGWEEVQRANMSKVRAQRADQSKRGTAFDVVKPAGFLPPNIEKVLQEAHEVANDLS